MIAGAVEAPSGLPGSCVSSEPPPQVTDALGASVRALFLAAGLPSRVQDPCLTSSSPDAPSSWPSGHLFPAHLVPGNIPEMVDCAIQPLALRERGHLTPGFLSYAMWHRRI